MKKSKMIANTNRKLNYSKHLKFFKDSAQSGLSENCTEMTWYFFHCGISWMSVAFLCGTSSFIKNRQVINHGLKSSHLGIY